MIGSVLLFAVAFGWVEAVVVVYLRELLYPDGFDFPLRLLPTELAVVEVAREAATLLMLLGVALLGARTAWGRFGLFALAFGIWDLVYYVGLAIVVGWPASLATWDVLFLIPGVWTGPVWSAALVAVLLVAFGVVFYLRGEAGEVERLRARHWILALASFALVVGAFLANHSLVLAEEIPTDFPLWVYLAGVTAGLAAAVDLLRNASDQ